MLDDFFWDFEAVEIIRILVWHSDIFDILPSKIIKKTQSCKTFFKALRELHDLSLHMLFDFESLFLVRFYESSNALIEIHDQLIFKLDLWHFHFFLWSVEVIQTTVGSLNNIFLSNFLQCMHIPKCSIIKLISVDVGWLFNHQGSIVPF